jgi:hypothetical protein
MLSRLFCIALLLTEASTALGLGTARFVSEAESRTAFQLFKGSNVVSIIASPAEWPGVLKAAHDLAGDVNQVCGARPRVETNRPTGKNAVVIGTLGRSGYADELVKAGRLDPSSVVGKPESAVIQIIEHPWPGVDRALVIAGSDKRGTIYGIYELSEQIGISPWHWWADVPAKKHSQLFVNPGPHVIGPPGVKYRGIFINDEGPCLMTWARQRYGELNHGMYTNVFELILRLKGNYLWPAMWDNSFATDDPLNSKLADEYGVIIGTSHHEPMMRAWKEWERSGHKKGSWDYSKNPEVLRKFWADGVQRTKDYEKLITIGMRGDGDEPMSETDSISLLEKIVHDQRQIISDVMGTNAAEVPQLWALYKEVQGYYEKGMRVPDDVTLLWCDDNWGNIRRVPTSNERARAGGAGIYYHFDYVGGPRNYKWVNTTPLPKVWEQMNLARAYGADRLWIVNVGDIKPLELPLEYFLSLAWNPERWRADNISEFTRLWAEREFGAEYAEQIADIVTKYAKYNGRRKPELLEPGTFSLENYGEADRVLADWRAIASKAEDISEKLPAGAKDAFFELVLYPAKASAVVNEMYIAAAKNKECAARGDAQANVYAQRVRELFAEDARLSDYYNHRLAGGKWNHMMDQTHIGYTGWQQPDSNSMPAVVEIADASVPSKTESNNVSIASPPTLPTPTDLPSGWTGFIEQDGRVSIEAEHFTKKVDGANTRWTVLPDHGRTLSAVTLTPSTAPSVEPTPATPRLEYNVWLSTTGKVETTLILSPALNFSPDRGVRIAASWDNAPIQPLTVVPKDYRAGDGNRDWEESVKNAVRKVKFTSDFPVPTGSSTSGSSHTLKIWMVDPGVVLQKVTVDCGGLKPSYLGPPESRFIGNSSTTASVTTEEDHREMMQALGIKSLRPGRNGMNSKDPNHANYDESKANPYPDLPNPLRLDNGTAVTSPEAWWNKRRPEIVESFDREIYGRVPSNTPTVSWKVISTKTEATNGFRLLTKELVGEVDNSRCPSIKVSIPLTVTTPADAKGPVPLMIQFGFNFANFRPPPSRTNPFPARAFTNSGPTWKEQLLSNGWGYAILTPTSIQADNGAGLREGIIGLCNCGGSRKPDDWGALRAWAWGASRALDYLATDKNVDAQRVGIEGHSRYGKAALVTMAYDPRFAIAYVSSSGEGGAKLHRRDYGEIVENLASSGEYHWMAGNFMKYAGPLNWSDLPVDSHELIALCAPRPVFFSAGSTNGDAWVDAKGSFIAVAAAGPVYRLLGKADVGAEQFPPIGTRLIAGDLAFCQHTGGHSDAPTWPVFIEFANRVLKRP